MSFVIFFPHVNLSLTCLIMQDKTQFIYIHDLVSEYKIYWHRTGSKCLEYDKHCVTTCSLTSHKNIHIIYAKSETSYIKLNLCFSISYELCKGSNIYGYKFLLSSPQLIFYQYQSLWINYFLFQESILFSHLIVCIFNEMHGFQFEFNLLNYTYH
jgi:hypothetical protein